MRKILGVVVALSFAVSFAAAAPSSTTTKPSTTTTTTKPAATTSKPAATTAKPAATTAKPAAKKATSTKVEPYVDAGDVVVNAGISYGGYYSGYGLAAGAEYDFARIDAGGLPITFGAATRASIQFGGYIDTVWSLSAMGTAHLSLKGIKIPTSYGWASNFDTYMGLGLAVAGGSDSYWTVTPGVGLALIVGETYYLNDKLGFNFEYGYQGNFKYYGYSPTAYYASLGVIYKL